MSATHDIQVPIIHLAECHQRLGQILAAAGLNPTQLNDLFNQAIRLECAICSLPLSASELGLLAVGGASAIASSPKLQRLHLGDCARTGCNSRFYMLRCRDFSGVNWEAVLQEYLRPAPVETAEYQTALAAAGSGKARLWLNVAAVLAFFLICGIGWRLYTGQSIPVLQPKHKFSLDPKSVEEAKPETETVGGGKFTIDPASVSKTNR